MKKTILLLAIAAMAVACANAQQTNENFDTYEFDGSNSMSTTPAM